MLPIRYFHSNNRSIHLRHYWHSLGQSIALFLISTILLIADQSEFKRQVARNLLLNSNISDLSLIPYGGNVRGVALININGDVISLTPDNQNIGLIQQIFGVFDTVKAIFPTQYLGTDVSDLTLTIIIAGGVQNYLETNNILTSTPNETNIFLGVVDSQPASISTLNTAIFSDSAGYLIPANFNVNYLSKISDIAKQAGFPIN